VLRSVRTSCVADSICCIAYLNWTARWHPRTCPTSYSSHSLNRSSACTVRSSYQRTKSGGVMAPCTALQEAVEGVLCGALQSAGTSSRYLPFPAPWRGRLRRGEPWTVILLDA
jgi:hypothetical protein